MKIKFDRNKVLDWALGEIDWSSGTGESLIYQIYEEYPEYDPEQTEGAEDPPVDLLNEFANDYIDSKIDDMAYDLGSLVDRNGNIEIWRVITAKKSWKPTDRDLGVFWSWDKNTADAHWGAFGKGHVKWRIGSIAHIDQVDWSATIALNINPSIGEDEKEIRLIDGVEVPIISLERDGKPVSVDKYQGIKFRANPRRR